jgi:hypothetical protein
MRWKSRINEPRRVDMSFKRDGTRQEFIAMTDRMVFMSWLIFGLVRTAGGEAMSNLILRMAKLNNATESANFAN